MPTALRAGPYRVYFYSSDLAEPPHMHVDRDDCTAKFWLDPVRLVNYRGFGFRELHRIERLLSESEAHLLEVWFGHLGP